MVKENKREVVLLSLKPDHARSLLNFLQGKAEGYSLDVLKKISGRIEKRLAKIVTEEKKDNKPEESPDEAN